MIIIYILQEHESLINKDPIDKEKLVVKIKKEKADDLEKKKKKRKKIDEGGDASKPKKIKDPNKVKMKVKIKKEPSKDKLPVIKQEDIADFGMYNCKSFLYRLVLFLIYWEMCLLRPKT